MLYKPDAIESFGLNATVLLKINQSWFIIKNHDERLMHSRNITSCRTSNEVEYMLIQPVSLNIFF